MDLANETLAMCRNESGPEAAACSCALHEPRHDRDRASPAGIPAECTRFASFSEAWLAHARDFGPHALRRFNLGAGSLVLEIAGPARTTGVSGERVEFRHETALGLAARGRTADLVIANNVLARVSEPNDVVAGIAAILKPDGILTFEFPHLLRLTERSPFAGIDHGELPYFSLTAAQFLLARQGLRVFDVDTLPALGGSLRLFCCHAGSTQPEQAGVARLRAIETRAGLHDAAYRGFAGAHSRPAVAV